MKLLAGNKFIATALGVATAVVVPKAVLAVDECNINAGVTGGANCAKGSTIAGPSLQSQVANITNTLLIVIGAVSVIMILIGGLRYVLSGGDEAGTRSAKDTILYSVIGLVIALLAYVIVNFVLKQLHVI